MYIDTSTIIQVAAVFTAAGVLVGAIIAVYKLVENNKKQSQRIEDIMEEQTVICYGLKGALQGLIEQGCNGPCKDALERLDKHLNKKAHVADL